MPTVETGGLRVYRLCDAVLISSFVPIVKTTGYYMNQNTIFQYHWISGKKYWRGPQLVSDLEAEQAGKGTSENLRQVTQAPASPPFPLKNCSFPDQESKRNRNIFRSLSYGF